MEVGSKIAIQKIKEFTDKTTNQKYYRATLIENVYNPARATANKWEFAFYNAIILINDFPYTSADFSLKKDKTKYSFKNIANPKESIFRVGEFRYEEHTIWKNNQIQVDDAGKTLVKPIFYITKVYDAQEYKSQERVVGEMQRKIDYNKQVNNELRIKHKEEIAVLKAEIKSLKHELYLNGLSLEKAERTVEKHKNKVSSVLGELQRNGRLKKKLERTEQKLVETTEQVKAVKQMKKEQFIDNEIKKANNARFDDFDFGEL